MILSFNHVHYPFPTYRCFLTPLQQTTFENIVTKEEIALNKQFLLFPTMFSTLFNIKIKLSLMDIFHIYVSMFLFAVVDF